MISGRSVDNPRLEEAVRRLVRDLRPRAIILFGSRARGTSRPDSDYDLLVISDEIRDYDEVYRPVVGTGLPCDVVPCSVAAWRDAQRDAGGVLRDARDEGVVLYGQP
jgi:predicted nucleotidyltransferase